MLNGIDPIVIFNFKKKVPTVAAAGQSISILDQITNLIDLPAIPIYLSEALTGIVIDTETKSIDIDTTVTALVTGAAPLTSQRPIQSTVKIQMHANSASLGVSLFSAMSDLIFPKVTSKEYSVTYLHGAVTVFAGLLHSFSIDQQQDNDLYTITLELIKPAASLATGLPVVPGLPGALPA